MAIHEQTAALVRKTIDDNGVKVSWLIEQTGIPSVTMHRRLAGQVPFSINELGSIADALRVPLHSLIPVAATSQVGAA